MGTIASHITSLTIVYSSVYSGTDQRKHQSSASLAFVRGIHRWSVNSTHKRPVTRKMFPFDDVMMKLTFLGFTLNMTEMSTWMWVLKPFKAVPISARRHAFLSPQTAIERLHSLIYRANHSPLRSSKQHYGMHMIRQQLEKKYAVSPGGLSK